MYRRPLLNRSSRPISGRSLPRPMPKRLRRVTSGPARKHLATVDAFIAYNKAFAEAQAAEQGVTVAEVADYTFFGFLVMQSQQWPSSR